VLGDPDSPVTAKKLREGLTAVVAALRGSALQTDARTALEALGPEGSEDERRGLLEIGDLVDRLQVALARDLDKSVRPVAAAAAQQAIAVHVAAATPAPVSAPQQPAAARDAEMVDLLIDFVAESLEGIERADTILLTAEQTSADGEQVNALFRVFHSIKGVSGFLDIPEVTRLAHVTEALLDQVRQGNLELAGEALDVVLESSASMRGTLEALRKAATQGLPDPSDAALPALLARIESASSVVVRPPPGQGDVPEEQTAGSQPAAPSVQVSFALADAGDVAPAPPVSAKPGEPRSGRVRDTVKVDLERVDSIVEMVGELLIVESMVVNAPELSRLATAKLRHSLSQMTKISRDLQNATMRMRMVPLAGVFRKMTRLVRDLSRATGKLVQLELDGEGTEMDRSMVERIEDPLVHMIRNAVDHGIELPEERRSLGKPPVATLRLSAAHDGGSVAIGLTDNGRGLPRDKILKKARERGLLRDSGDALTDQEVYALIFLPGFSTASEVTEISGRGVGMDVVKRSVEDMRGRVLVDSTRGAGTSFKLIFPLTLAIIDGMLVTSGEERYIIPSLAIVESLQPTPEMVHTVGDGTELIRVRGEILSLLRLGSLFNVPGAAQATEQTRCVIVESAGRKLGLLVDDILTQQQVVIKPLGSGLGDDVELLAGAAILPDGRVGLILNVDRLGGQVGRRRGANSDRGETAA
jgi:two-component system chemotaxis sensor kinase CheA